MRSLPQILSQHPWESVRAVTSHEECTHNWAIVSCRAEVQVSGNSHSGLRYRTGCPHVVLLCKPEQASGVTEQVWQRQSRHLGRPGPGRFPLAFRFALCGVCVAGARSRWQGGSRRVGGGEVLGRDTVRLVPADMVDVALVDPAVVQVFVNCRGRQEHTFSLFAIRPTPARIRSPCVCSLTTNPPPTEKYSFVAIRVPSSSKTEKRMPFGCAGSGSMRQSMSLSCE